MHNSFGTFGFSVTGNPCPVLNVSSSYASMSEISIVYLETNQHLSDIEMAPHKGSVPVLGNGSYMVTVMTNMGTFYTNIIIHGLYDPSDMGVMLPIDNPVKIKY